MRGGRNFKENEMITLVTLPLNVKEYERLELFAKAHDMSEQQILIQGLRLYDTVDSGEAELVFKKDENFFMSEDMIESAVDQMQAQFDKESKESVDEPKELKDVARRIVSLSRKEEGDNHDPEEFQEWYVNNVLTESVWDHILELREEVLRIENVEDPNDLSAVELDMRYVESLEEEVDRPPENVTLGGVRYKLDDPKWR